jgi:hypothetical protein
MKIRFIKKGERRIMKKLFMTTIILLVGVLIAGCSNQSSIVTTPPRNAESPVTTSVVMPAPTPTPTQTKTQEAASAYAPAHTPTRETAPAPTPGPDTLVINTEVFARDIHQFGEIHVAPGQTFSVNLAYDETLKRIWDEAPELTNEGIADKVDYQKVSTFQSWTFKAADDGVCLVLFKTGGEAIESREWTYSLAVAVLPDGQTTFTGKSTLEQTLAEAYDDVTDWDNMFIAYIDHSTFVNHGQLEGQMEWTMRHYVDLRSGGVFWSRCEVTFTGTVDGKSGTLDIYKISKGTGSMWKGQGTNISIFFGGTGELANLRGISYIDWSYTVSDARRFPPMSKTIGTMSNTLWYLE